MVENDINKFKQLLACKKRPNGKPYINGAFKQGSKLQRIANEFILDVLMSPENYVSLPTAYTLDYSRYFIHDEVLAQDQFNTIQELRSLLSLTRYQKELFEAKKEGMLYTYKLKDASAVCSRRIIGIKQVAKYLYQNSEFDALESVQLLTCAMKYHVTVLSHGKTKVSKIKNTNLHDIMPIYGSLALKTVCYLRKGYSIKEALVRGAVDTKKDQSKPPMQWYGHGWVHFPKSTDIEDVYKLKHACAGTDWCIEDIETALDYLSEGDFWIYSEGKVAEIALHYTQCEIGVYGRGENQDLLGKFAEIADSFMEELEVVKSLGTGVAHYDNELTLSAWNRSLLKDIISSISSGVIEDSLLQFVCMKVDGDRLEATLNFPSEMSYISLDIINQLNKMVKPNDIIYKSDDQTVSIKSNLYIEGKCDLLSSIVDVEGDVVASNLSSIELPQLVSVGGFLDIRNSDQVFFPNLKHVGEFVDAVGSEEVEMPHLDQSVKYISTYYSYDEY